MAKTSSRRWRRHPGTFLLPLLLAGCGGRVPDQPDAGRKIPAFDAKSEEQRIEESEGCREIDLSGAPAVAIETILGGPRPPPADGGTLMPGRYHVDRMSYVYDGAAPDWEPPPPPLATSREAMRFDGRSMRRHWVGTDEVGDPIGSFTGQEETKISGTTIVLESTCKNICTLGRGWYNVGSATYTATPTTLTLQWRRASKTRNGADDPASYPMTIVKHYVREPDK